jgi:hypothetical protein
MNQHTSTLSYKQPSPIFSIPPSSLPNPLTRLPFPPLSTNLPSRLKYKNHTISFFTVLSFPLYNHIKTHLSYSARRYGGKIGEESVQMGYELGCLLGEGEV